MTKQYGPRDLREACAMPREDAVWFMEHCAEEWEKLQENMEAMQHDRRLYEAELIALRQRLEAISCLAGAVLEQCADTTAVVALRAALAAGVNDGIQR